MQISTPVGPNTHITVCVSTRDRGDSIVPTLRSLAALDHDDFDVVVVDQSTDTRTRDAMQRAVGADRRFRYKASESVGLSAARNVAAAQASGALVAFTDDDCEVPPEWLSCLQRHFANDPRIGMVCGEVREGAHDATAGYIPNFYVQRPTTVTSPWLKWRARGIGANIAMRTAVLEAVGPFDEVLGAGGPLYSCEDGDMTYRVLRKGFSVMNVNDAYVVHHGFRDWRAAQVVLRHALLAVGATCVKHLRLGDIAMLPTLVYIFFGRCVSWRDLILLRRKSGLGRLVFYVYGMGLSFRYRIDRKTRTYVPPRPGRHAKAPTAAIRT